MNTHFENFVSRRYNPAFKLPLFSTSWNANSRFIIPTSSVISAGIVSRGITEMVKSRRLMFAELYVYKTVHNSWLRMKSIYIYRICRWRWIRYVHYESTINQTRVLRVTSVNDRSGARARRTSQRFIRHARFSQRDSYKIMYSSTFLLFIFARGITSRDNIGIKIFARLVCSHLFSHGRALQGLK